MRNPGSIEIDGRGYLSCTLEQGDSLAAVCLYFGYANWRTIFQMSVNDSFRQTYPDPESVSADFGAEPTFYVPAQSGTSGQQRVARLTQLETYCRQIEALERLESNATRLITYIRKIYYESDGWDIIIPRASNVDMPSSMQNDPSASLAIRYLKENQDLSVDGRFTDIRHFFTGLDARNHQQSLELGPDIWGMRITVLRLRDNREIATWVEDLGSVVVEYLHGTPCTARPRGHSMSFYDVARNHHPDILRDYHNNWASDKDMRGNVDGLLIPFNASQRFSQQFRSYFITNSDPRRQRFPRFRQQVGMQNNDSWKRPIKDEVYNAAIAYAGGTGRRTDVFNIYTQSPSILIPTFSQAYSNVSGWTVDMFVNWMMNATF